MENKKENEIKERLIESLKQVIDPGTNVNIIDMGLVKDISIDESGEVDLTFRPSSPVCPMAYKLADDIQRATKKVSGVNEVNIRVRDFVQAKELEQILQQPGK
ncbi:MAG: metal-sulfur cluster assembly factor [Bacillota bacterium]